MKKFAKRSVQKKSERPTFIAEGIRCYETFLLAGFKPLITYVTQETYDRYPQLHAHGITLVGERRMRALSSSSTPSGLAALFAIPLATAPVQWDRALICAHIQDPGNLGTLIRTAAAVGLTDVVTIGGAYPWSAKVIQAAAGAHAYVAIHDRSFEEIMRSCSAPIGALVTRGGEHPHAFRSQPITLMVGNEAQGLPSAWLAQLSTKITIPMPGKTESLNAAIAGSIALYAIFGPEN